jgi:hypothetical protein
VKASRAECVFVDWSVEEYAHFCALARLEAKLPISIQIDILLRGRVFDCKLISPDLLRTSPKFLEVRFQYRDKRLNRQIAVEAELRHTFADRTNSKWNGLDRPKASINSTGCWRSTCPGMLKRR